MSLVCYVPYTSESLPCGVDDGLARLRAIGFGVYGEGRYAGKTYFLAMGEVYEPSRFRGMETHVVEPLCITPASPKNRRRSFCDHYAWVLNQLRILGADTSRITFEDLERVVGELREAEPYFRFRTFMNEKGAVQHEWNGLAANYFDGSEWAEDSGGDERGNGKTRKRKSKS